jgi:hypothetical protein
MRGAVQQTARGDSGPNIVTLNFLSHPQVPLKRGLTLCEVDAEFYLYECLLLN